MSFSDLEDGTEDTEQTSMTSMCQHVQVCAGMGQVYETQEGGGRMAQAPAPAWVSHA